jgi:Domain of unknown function (DUF4440)
VKWFFIAVVGYAVLPQSYAQNPSDRNTASKIIALEQLVRVQALASEDPNSLNMYLADELVMVTPEGRSRTKSEFLAGLHSVHILRYSIHDILVRVHGTTSTATGLFHTTGVDGGRTFVRQGRFLDTWVNINGSWVMVATVAILMRDDR